jgi:hypothetical protein
MGGGQVRTVRHWVPVDERNGRELSRCEVEGRSVEDDVAEARLSDRSLRGRVAFAVRHRSTTQAATTPVTTVSTTSHAATRQQCRRWHRTRLSIEC